MLRMISWIRKLIQVSWLIKSKWLLVCGVIFLFVTSCSKSKAVTDGRGVPNKKPEEILSLMAAEELKCDWVSIKYDVEIKTADFDDSFKMYIRLKQDSAIWVSATYYSVEVARFLFTTDSVKFMDRKNDQYYIGPYDYIAERFGVDANYELLQALILANAVNLIAHGPEQEKIRSLEDDGAYLLTFLRKGQMKRAMKKEDYNKEIDLNIGLWIDPQTFRMRKTSITDFESDRILTAVYDDYQQACNTSHPQTTVYTVTSSNEQAEVKTSVIKLTSGKKVSLSFTIPEKYEALVP